MSYFIPEQNLSIDASGNITTTGSLTAASISAGAISAAGSNTEIQFNNNGVFGASGGLLWTGTTLSATSLLTVLGGGISGNVNILNPGLGGSPTLVNPPPDTQTAPDWFTVSNGGDMFYYGGFGNLAMLGNSSGGFSGEVQQTIANPFYGTGSTDGTVTFHVDYSNTINGTCTIMIFDGTTLTTSPTGGSGTSGTLTVTGPVSSSAPNLFLQISGVWTGPNVNGTGFQFSNSSATFSSTTAIGKMGVGTALPDLSAVLDLTSTTLGFLPPRMTAAQRDAIVSPAEGLIVYVTDLFQLWEYQNGAWAAIGGGGGGAPVVQKNVVTSSGQSFSITDPGYYFYDCSGGFFCSVNLPDATVITPGLPITVYNIGADGSQQVQFTAFNDAQTIDGVPSGPSNPGNYSLSPVGTFGGSIVKLISDGSVWVVDTSIALQGNENTVYNTPVTINTLTITASLIAETGMTMNGSTISNVGEIDMSGGSGSITGIVNLNGSNFSIDNNGNAIFNGTLSTSSADFSVNASGDIVTTGSLQIGSGNFLVDTSGNIIGVGLNVGSGNFTVNGATGELITDGPNFQVNANGDMRMTSITTFTGNFQSDVNGNTLIGGTVTAGAGSFSINASGVVQIENSLVVGTSLAFKVDTNANLSINTTQIELNADGSASFSNGALTIDTGGNLATSGTLTGAGITSTGSFSTDNGSITTTGSGSMAFTAGNLTVGGGSTALNADGSVAFAVGNVSIDTSGNLTVAAGIHLTVTGQTGSTPALYTSATSTVGIGTNTPDASAILDIESSTQGFLPPRMDTTTKTAIATPAEGLVVYDTTLHKLSVWTGAAWETVTSV